MERYLHYSRGGRKGSAGVESVTGSVFVPLAQLKDFLALRTGVQGAGDLEIQTVKMDLD
jgi:hypothetical protein